MFRSIATVLVLIIILGPGAAPAARADDDGSVSLLRSVALAAAGPAPDRSGFDQLPAVAQLTMFSGTDTLVALIALGDRSPLKPVVGETAWARLVERLPQISELGAAMRESLVHTTLENLEKHDLSFSKTAIGAAAGALTSLEGAGADRLKKASLIYGARALLVPARDGAVARKLTALAVDPRVPAEVRKDATALLATGVALELKQQLAEAALQAELPPAP
jgi:hypothetical protein